MFVGETPMPQSSSGVATAAAASNDYRVQTMKALGITLIIAGILALALPYFTFTRNEKVLDVGPVEAYQQHEDRVPLSPIVGIAILLAGAGVLVAATRRIA